MNAGSSPLVRGKRTVGKLNGFLAGLIPAGAGKTPEADSPRAIKGAHPRWCGENLLVVLVEFLEGGSSPLVRGKPRQGIRPRHLEGLIPAGAGKTAVPPASGLLTAAHPRWCGENSELRRYGRHSLGSSPLVRGKLGLAQAQH